MAVFAMINTRAPPELAGCVIPEALKVHVQVGTASPPCIWMDWTPQRRRLRAYAESCSTVLTCHSRSTTKSGIAQGSEPKLKA